MKREPGAAEKRPRPDDFTCHDCGKRRRGQYRETCRICVPTIHVCGFCAEKHDRQHKHDLAMNEHSCHPDPVKKVKK